MVLQGSLRPVIFLAYGALNNYKVYALISDEIFELPPILLF